MKRTEALALITNTPLQTSAEARAAADAIGHARKVAASLPNASSGGIEYLLSEQQAAYVRQAEEIERKGKRK